MKRFYSIVGALVIGATSLFAQTNYKVTFSANVEMDKIQVKNLNSGATKTLAKSDKVITLQKNAKQEQQGGTGTPIESVDQFEFLQQTASNEVVVNMEKAGRLNLTLYSSNGTFVTRYANNVDAGPNAFQIGASSGMYVLVASANNQTASLKILLTQSTEPSILEVLTSKPEPMLKSVNDVITFDEGDEFEFTGYYYSQTKVETLHSAFITSDKQIRFSFTKVKAPTVTTVEATNVTSSSATVGGNVTNDNGTSVTERGVCWATTANPTVSGNKIVSGKGTGSFSVTLSSLLEGTTYYVRAYAINNEGTSYGSETTFTTIKKTVTIVNGAIPKAFSVSATKKVYFSQGNLQYQASTGTWRFAENQWDIVGAYHEGNPNFWGTVYENGTKCENNKISSTYSGWIDLFGWATSGYHYYTGVDYTAYQPYSSSTDKWDYFNPYSLQGDYAKADWGVYNAISNGGNKSGMWRTLNSGEWIYVLNRQNRELWSRGTVNNQTGVILLPDDWETPSSVKFTPKVYMNYNTNVYSVEEWKVMQSYGAIFLPGAGVRVAGNQCSGGGGRYWTSTWYGNDSRSSVIDTDEYDYNLYRFGTLVSVDMSYGYPVRLVQDVK